MRLQRYLSQSGVASRRQAEELIKSGSVTINGEVVSEAGVDVAETDRVEVMGRRVAPEKPIYRLMLKPRACLSNFEDKGERATLRRYLPTQEPGLTVVGPLDFPSEGVLLLTTDGELADVMSRRRQKVPMAYHLKLQGAVRDEELDRLSRGWYAEERPVKPISVTALATTGKNSWVEVVVAETRPRALKAIGDFLHHTVLKISRVRFGSLSFQGLAMGGWRDLTKAEVATLRGQAGLTDHDPRGVGASPAQAPEGEDPARDARRGPPRRSAGRPRAAAAPPREGQAQHGVRPRGERGPREGERGQARAARGAERPGHGAVGRRPAQGGARRPARPGDELGGGQGKRPGSRERRSPSEGRGRGGGGFPREGRGPGRVGPRREGPGPGRVDPRREGRGPAGTPRPESRGGARVAGRNGRGTGERPLAAPVSERARPTPPRRPSKPRR